MIDSTAASYNVESGSQAASNDENNVQDRINCGAKDRHSPLTVVKKPNFIVAFLLTSPSHTYTDGMDGSRSEELKFTPR